MKISRKNFKRPIISNLEKLDKFKGKRKNAITRKNKMQQQRGGLFGFEFECNTFDCVVERVNKKLQHLINAYESIREKRDK